MPKKLVFSYPNSENKKLVPVPKFLERRKNSEGLKAENKRISTEDFTSWLESCSLNGIDVSQINAKILEESNTDAVKDVFKKLLSSQKPAKDFSSENLINFNLALRNIQANISHKETHTEPATSASREAITGVQENIVNSKQDTARNESHTNKPIMEVGKKSVSTTPQQKNDAKAQALKAQIEITVGLAIKAGVASMSKQKVAEAAKVRSEAARINADNTKEALRLKTIDFDKIQTSIVDTNTQLETNKVTLKQKKSELEAKQEELNNKSVSIQTLTNKINDKTTELRTQQNTLDSESQKLEGITAKVNALEVTLNDVKNSKKGVLAFFVDLYRSIFNPSQTYANRLNIAQSNLTIAQINYREVEKAINDIQKDIETTKLTIDGATKAKEALENDFSSMQSEMKALADEVKSRTAKNNELSNVLNTLQTKASEIMGSQKSAADLEAQAKELEETATSANRVATKSTQAAQSALEAAIALNPSSANDIRQKIEDGIRIISATKPPESNAATAVITPPTSTNGEHKPTPRAPLSGTPATNSSNPVLPNTDVPPPEQIKTSVKLPSSLLAGIKNQNTKLKKAEESITQKAPANSNQETITTSPVRSGTHIQETTRPKQTDLLDAIKNSTTKLKKANERALPEKKVSPDKRSDQTKDNNKKSPDKVKKWPTVGASVPKAEVANTSTVSTAQTPGGETPNEQEKTLSFAERRKMVSNIHNKTSSTPQPDKKEAPILNRAAIEQLKNRKPVDSITEPYNPSKMRGMYMVLKSNPSIQNLGVSKDIFDSEESLKDANQAVNDICRLIQNSIVPNEQNFYSILVKYQSPVSDADKVTSPLATPSAHSAGSVTVEESGPQLSLKELFAKRQVPTASTTVTTEPAKPPVTPAPTILAAEHQTRSAVAADKQKPSPQKQSLDLIKQGVQLKRTSLSDTATSAAQTPTLFNDELLSKAKAAHQNQTKVNSSFDDEEAPGSRQYTGNANPAQPPHSQTPPVVKQQPSTLQPKEVPMVTVHINNGDSEIFKQQKCTEQNIYILNRRLVSNEDDPEKYEVTLFFINSEKQSVQYKVENPDILLEWAQKQQQSIVELPARDWGDVKFAAEVTEIKSASQNQVPNLKERIGKIRKDIGGDNDNDNDSKSLSSLSFGSP